MATDDYEDNPTLGDDDDEQARALQHRQRPADLDGVPKTLHEPHPPGYRSVNPNVGVAAGVAIGAVVLWGVWAVLPHGSATAAPSLAALTSTSQSDQDGALPDPSPTPFVRQPPHPFVRTTQAPQAPYGGYVPAPVPRVRSAEEIAAEEEARRRIEARRGSSRMHLEAPQDLQALDDLAQAGQQSPNAADVRRSRVTRPAPQQAAGDASSSFAAEPHERFIA
ncbi:MAG: hypothetical protein ACREM6_16590, partial [Vulcanimicrobiaceae bacterium]